jgi:hypothetical protein
MDDRASEPEERELALIREIGRQKAKNRFYRSCYALLKELQEVTEQAVDDLLLLYHSDLGENSSRRGYRPVIEITERLQRDLGKLTTRESDAVTAWNRIWS